MQLELDLFTNVTDSWELDYKGDKITIEQIGDKYRYVVSGLKSRTYCVMEWMLYNCQRELDILRGRLILRKP
jgi:hypothetical protein